MIHEISLIAESTEAKDVLPNINHMQDAALPSPLAATEWSHLLLHDLVCRECGPLRRCWGVLGVQFFVPGDLDLWPWHSNLSEWGTKHVFPVNLAQVVQWLPRYLIHKQKKQRSHSSKNRTLCSLLHTVKTLQSLKTYINTVNSVQIFRRLKTKY